MPPGNVRAEAVNSTTVRFTWSAPSPQFINGINQGYKVSGPLGRSLVRSSGQRQESTLSCHKPDQSVSQTNPDTIRMSPQSFVCHHFQLLAWEPSRPNEVTAVTVRPNFQDSVHVGYISGLKRFTEYHTSVLCFTTPGDGPRSPPQRLRTHEDSKDSRSGCRVCR